MSNPLRDAHTKGYVTGLKQFGVVDRLDVDVLLKTYPDTFNLFLIAIKQLQDSKGNKGEFTEWSDKFSFFQIAGIHGLPHALWDGEGGKKNPDDRDNRFGSGYCAHATQSFPTWHRPYLAMLEQALYEKMLDIAELYNEPRKSDYKKAVEKFRLPFWDYHRPRDYNARFPGVRLGDATTFYPYDFRAPQIFTVANVKVQMYPDDREVQIPNPLNRFTYPDANTGFFKSQDWDSTGFSQSSPSRLQTRRQVARNPQWKDPVLALNAEVNNVREDTLRLSLNFIEQGPYDRYMDFATAGVFGAIDPLDGQQANGSLEGIHGGYHNYIGRGGHMSMVTTAAFDPIFWFHHCQIDRWFAIWQGAHPTDPLNPTGKRWFATPGEAQSRNLDDTWTTATTPLLPFRHPDQTKTKYWNSNLSYKTSNFGYRYPDLLSSDSPDPTAVQKRFKDTYQWARRLVNSPNNKAAPPKEMEPLNLDDSKFFRGIDDFTPLNKPKPVALQPTFSLMSLSEVPALKATSFSLAPEAQPEAFAAKVEALPSVQAPISTAPEVSITEEHVSREWYIDDVVQRLALNGSFSILYFLGDFDASLPPSSLGLAPTFVGNTHIFTAPIQACDNCGHQDQQAHLVTNTTPMTAMLLDYEATGRLASLRPEHVKPFLVQNLKWRVVGPEGERIDPRVLAEDRDFKIAVSCKIAPLPGHETEESQVVYEMYPDITDEIIANAS
ncbi:Di-copper centre-containing protein [Polyplosphaeria fusca]|uniref:tyrosinase n=1 Tax=Polyplosphaeria fusca TaxID=682080 RepID=A0A9P4V0B1_9PLEO|nr:Di-copper centre-containing protein [Polyplosphaeria fusca]